MTRVGIFGGSFNPVHLGHLRLAEAALSELGLDQVLFVPSYRTPLKNPKILLPESLRLGCLRQALKARRRFALSDHEMRRKGISYTVETLAHFRKKFGPKTTLYFLAGADTAGNFSRWKSPDKVIKLCRFAVFSRPGVPKSRTVPEALQVHFPALDISSSQIRRRWWAGESLKNFVPASVERMMKRYKRKVLAKSKRKKRSP
jgi:nicotinate-nucleotide adenylyltransferase